MKRLRTVNRRAKQAELRDAQSPEPQRQPANCQPKSKAPGQKKAKG